ncbi:hypothetical protein C8R46DRAFT_1114747 [Mycena filopes]|nr:hypothetical protein C8R46DRAFT_1114747 [Mycena filopes]
MTSGPYKSSSSRQYSRESLSAITSSGSVIDSRTKILIALQSFKKLPGSSGCRLTGVLWSRASSSASVVTGLLARALATFLLGGIYAVFVVAAAVGEGTGVDVRINVHGCCTLSWLPYTFSSSLLWIGSSSGLRLSSGCGSILFLLEDGRDLSGPPQSKVLGAFFWNILGPQLRNDQRGHHRRKVSPLIRRERPAGRLPD